MLAEITNDRIVLGDLGAAQAERHINLHAASPILIGLTVPMVAVYILDPGALQHARLMLPLLLVSLFFVSLVLFAHALLIPGDVKAVAFDATARRVNLVREGLFSKNNLDIPFSQVAGLRMNRDYDGDGYDTVTAQLVLVTRDVVDLPEGTTEADLATIRRATGLHEVRAAA